MSVQREPLKDQFGRSIQYLRISVTDRCNFRCVYCMPAEGLAWLPKQEILSYEEITEVEKAARSYARRSIVAARDLPAGTEVQFADLDFKRPGTGLSPTLVDTVVGRRLKAAVPYDGLILPDNLAS